MQDTGQSSVAFFVRARDCTRLDPCIYLHIYRHGTGEGGRSWICCTLLTAFALTPRLAGRHPLTHVIRGPLPEFLARTGMQIASPPPVVNSTGLATIYMCLYKEVHKYLETAINLAKLKAVQ